MSIRTVKVSVCLLAIGILCAAAYIPEACARESRIALFQLETHAREDLSYISSGMRSLLPTRIAVPGKISVIDQHTIDQALKKNISDYTAEELLQLAQSLDADFFLKGSITKIGSTISVDAQLIDVLYGEKPLPVVLQCRTMDDLIPQLSQFARTIKEHIIGGPVLEDYSPSRRSQPDAQPYGRAAQQPAAQRPVQPPPPAYEPPPKPAFKPLAAVFAQAPAAALSIKSRPLHCLADADIDGDGTPELLAAGDDRLHVIQRQGSDLTEAGTVDVASGETIIRVDAMDVNENGRDELYVSCFDGHRASSFVVEQADGTYKRLAENQRFFFRKYTSSDGTAKLMAQQTDIAAPFTGTIFRIDWKDGTLITREEIILPGSPALYGCTEGDIDNDGSKEFIAFHKGLFSIKYQLHIYSFTGRVEWRDTMELGGSPKSFSHLLYGDDIEQSVYIPMRVLCEDVNGDGRLEVITVNNYKKGTGLLKKILDYNRGEVVCLHWDGADLSQNWSSGTVENYVSDYILTDMDRDGRKELYMLSVEPGGFIGKAVNTITAYATAP